MEKVSLNNNFFKILLIIAFLLTFIALLSLNATLPITGYEISIYAAAPLFWFFIVLSNIVIIFIMIFQAQNKNYKFFWGFFALLLLNNFIILVQPLLRGYFLYGSGDPYGHYIFTKSIIEQGYFGENYYPITHLLVGGLSEITSINIETLMKFLPPYFSMFFIIFIYFLGKEVFRNKQYAVLLVAVSSTFLFTYYQVTLYPQGISAMLLPLVFYLFYKSDAPLINYKIIFVLFLFLLPFFHPYIEIIFISSLISAEIIKYLLDRKSLNKKFNLNRAWISIITFFIWWSSFAIFVSSIQKVNSWMGNEVTTVPRTNEVAFTQQMTLIDTISLTLKNYGPEIIYIFIALIAIILIFYLYFKGNKELKKLIILSGLFITTTVSYLMIFLSQGTISIGRLLGSNISMFAVPPLVAFSLYLVLKNLNKKKLAFLLIFIVISSSFTLSTIGMYRSSWIQQPNWQFSYSDYNSLIWENDYLDNHLKERLVYRNYHIGIPMSGEIIRESPFNFSNSTSITKFFDNGTLILIATERQNLIMSDINLYQSSLLAGWADPDLDEKTMSKIKSDSNLGYIYSNGANDIYLVVNK